MDTPSGISCALDHCTNLQIVFILNQGTKMPPELGYDDEDDDDYEYDGPMA